MNSKYKKKHKHKFHKWIIYDCGCNIIVTEDGEEYILVDLVCIECGIHSSFFVTLSDFDKLCRYYKNGWLFSNINHVVGRD